MILRKFVIAVVFLVNISYIRCQENPVDPTQRQFLENLLKGYDVNEWPNYDRANNNELGDETTEIAVQVFVNSFGSLNAANMDYSIDMFLRQRWMDQRLKFNPRKRKTIPITNPQMQDRIWKPDTFFQNVKNAQVHTVTMPNKLLRIYHTGEVLFSLRVTLVLACPMGFEDYPFDSQKCDLNITSYASTDDVIKYAWANKAPIDMPTDLEIAQFDLISNETYEITYEYETGNFSGLTVQFHVKRQNGYHVLQTYVPTILIVSISWVSFWLDANAVPGRVSLGVTTLLTLTTLAAGIRQSLPPVSYIKAIDVWVGMCMFMVFGALLEFTVANWLANQKVINRVSMKEEVEFNPSPSSAVPVKTYKNLADMLDKSCRAVFPAVFLIFNIIYWPYYLSQASMA